MKKLLLFVILCFSYLFTDAQKTIWWEAKSAYIGVKEPSQYQYYWGEENKCSIDIAVETSRIVVYAEHTFIVNIEGMISDGQPAVFYGTDDEGDVCRVELGYNSEINMAYIMFRYANIAFLYYCIPK